MRNLAASVLLALCFSADGHRLTVHECRAFATDMALTANERPTVSLEHQYDLADGQEPACRLNDPLRCIYKDAEDDRRFRAAIALTYSQPLAGMTPIEIGRRFFDRCVEVAPAYGRGDQHPA